MERRACSSTPAPAPTVTILLILLLLTFVGTWADLGPSLIILAPIVHPIGIEAGLAPYQLGLIFAVALGIGLFTPPVGTNIFVVCNIAKVGVNAVTWRLIPFFITSNICLLLIAFVPATTEWLPQAISGSTEHDDRHVESLTWTATSFDASGRGISSAGRALPASTACLPRFAVAAALMSGTRRARGISIRRSASARRCSAMRHPSSSRP